MLFIRATHAIWSAEQKIQALKEALAEEKETVENAEKWIALIKECGKPTELTA